MPCLELLHYHVALGYTLILIVLFLIVLEIYVDWRPSHHRAGCVPTEDPGGASGGGQAIPRTVLRAFPDVSGLSGGGGSVHGCLCALANSILRGGWRGGGALRFGAQPESPVQCRGADSAAAAHCVSAEAGW
jgi:hypothetical protein